jgi:hypothetical protein
MMSIRKLVDSLSLWERAGVRGAAKGDSTLVRLPSALTLTLSQREREESRQSK